MVVGERVCCSEIRHAPVHPTHKAAYLALESQSSGKPAAKRRRARGRDRAGADVIVSRKCGPGWGEWEQGARQPRGAEALSPLFLLAAVLDLPVAADGPWADPDGVAALLAPAPARAGPVYGCDLI